MLSHLNMNNLDLLSEERGGGTLTGNKLTSALAKTDIEWKVLSL